MVDRLAHLGFIKFAKVSFRVVGDASPFLSVKAWLGALERWTLAGPRNHFLVEWRVAGRPLSRLRFHTLVHFGALPPLQLLSR